MARTRNRAPHGWPDAVLTDEPFGTQGRVNPGRALCPTARKAAVFPEAGIPTTRKPFAMRAARAST
ncbi:MAG: hypothetical protein WAM10_00185, partial [Methylocella sp.]